MSSKVPLGEVAKFINGRAFKPSDWGSNGLPIIRIQNLTNAEAAFNYYNKGVEEQYYVKNGDLLISWSATLDAFIWNRGDAILNQHIFKAIPRADKISKKFLYYAVTHVMDELRAQTHGVTMKHITRKPFEQTKIYLPPLPEQERLVRLLDEAESIRATRERANARMEQFVPALFQEMFGDAFDGLAKDTPLVRLDSICTKITDGTHVTPKYLEDGVPFLSVKNITKKLGSLDFSDVKYISREEHEKISRLSNVERDDLLYTKVGATYGYAQIVDTDKEFSIFVSVALLKPDKTKIIPKYLEGVMNTDFIKNQADRRIKGIGVPDLHLKEIRSFVVPLPPLALQHEFAARVEAARGVQSAQGKSAEKIEALYQSMLSRAFAGEL